MLLHLFFLMLILAAAASTNASKNHGKRVAPKKTEDSPARGAGSLLKSPVPVCGTAFFRLAFCCARRGLSALDQTIDTDQRLAAVLAAPPDEDEGRDHRAQQSQQ